MKNASEVLSGQQTPEELPEPPATSPALSEQERKRQRREIYCTYCQRFHRLPRSASEGLERSEPKGKG